MGPMRESWSFPVEVSDLIERCKAREAELVALIDKQLTEEQVQEANLADYRDRLRQAGVNGWATAIPPQESSGIRYSDPISAARTRYQKASKELALYQSFRAALEYDFKRQPDRLYKCSYDDLKFFGFTNP